MDKTSMKPAARSFGFGNVLLLVGALAGLIFGSAACADPEGTTPTCVQDVDEGTHANVDNGCNPFALCVKPDMNGTLQIVNAEQCCKSLTNPTEHQICLAGYGVGDFPNAEMSSSSSSSGKP
jgi:hypothetical protein